MKLINFGLMKQPMNWVTVLLMVYIAGIAVHLVLTHYSLVRTGADVNA